MLKGFNHLALHHLPSLHRLRYHPVRIGWEDGPTPTCLTNMGPCYLSPRKGKGLLRRFLLHSTICTSSSGCGRFISLHGIRASTPTSSTSRARTRLGRSLLRWNLWLPSYYYGKNSAPIAHPSQITTSDSIYLNSPLHCILDSSQ
jgi:hypothetical protein